MNRTKRFIIPFVFILLLVVGGVFYLKNQKDVIELNKSLPEGIKVMKSLNGNYRITNGIDGYEFKIPKQWDGIKEIEYTAEWTEKGYEGKSINIKGKKGDSRIIAIDRYKIDNSNIELESWSKNIFDDFGLIGEFRKDKLGDFDVVKTQENVHLLGMSVYFFRKDSTIYAITGGSEEFIQDIIINGKW